MVIFRSRCRIASRAKWMLSQKTVVPNTKTTNGSTPFTGTASPYGNSRSTTIAYTAPAYRARQEGWTSFCSTDGLKRREEKPKGKTAKLKRQYLCTTNSWPNIQEVIYEPLG